MAKPGEANMIVGTLPVRGEDAGRQDFSLRQFFRVWAGPGLLMSIAYVDPGNLEGDLQSGASAGYALLWVLLWGTALGYVIQMQAAKLGVVTGRNLAEHCRASFSPGPRYLLWVMIELAIIGSDIQEVTGSAIALLLLSRGAIPLWAGVLLSAVASFLLLLAERHGQRSLEALFGFFIAVMVAAFAYCFVVADVPLPEVAKGFLVPRLPRASIGQAVALLGSLIMPHNLYLHSALVQTRHINPDCNVHKREALMYFALESALTLAVSVFVNVFVVCVFAAGFYGQGVPGIGLENAGDYLGRTFGSSVVIIWGLGLLAAGQSSCMTGTYAGQFVMSGYLNIAVKPWMRVMITRSVALVPTLLVALLSNSSTGMDSLNQLLNLLQSIQLPFALLPLLAFNASERLMGKQFANSGRQNAITIAISVALIGVNMAGVYAVLEAALEGARPMWWALAGLGVLCYLAFIGYVARAAFICVDYSSSGSEQLRQPLLAPAGESEAEEFTPPSRPLGPGDA